MQDLVSDIADRVRSGSSLADALERHSGVFPKHYIGMVRAGEAGGALAAVMRSLADTLEQSLATRSSVRSALTYPIIVLAMAGLSVVILLTVVVPEFRPLFADTSATLPWSTRVLLAISEPARDFGWLATLVLLVAFLWLRRLSDKPAAQRQWHRWLVQAPLIGELVVKMDVSRFSRTLGSLLTSGVPAVEAVEMAQATLDNQAVAADLRSTGRRIAKGERLSSALADAGAVPQLAVRLVQVGEESGELESMLMHLADIYDQDIKRDIDRLLSVLTPAITIFLGIVVAVIVGSLFSAIFSTYSLSL